MIVKPALAVMLASSLVMSEAPKFVFPKPAIVKAENLDFSKHMLLGMPLTMGMLSPSRVTPITGSFVTSATSSSDLTTYTFSSVSIGTAASNRLVVVVATGEREFQRSFSSITVGGTALTRIVAYDNTANQNAGIYAGVITSGTTANIVVTWSSSMLCCGIGVFTVYGKTTPNAQATASGASSGTLNLIANDYVVCVACNGAGSASTPTNYTERIDVNAGGASLAAGDYVATGTSSRTFSAATVTAFACASWRAG